MWWAKPYDIIDNPMWHPADASAGNQNGTGSLVLRAETAHIVKEASSSVQYYSAYLWIMFEICDATGRLDWFRFGDWRRYLPIFEHTNIADGSTLTMLKELLAQKAITLIKDLEEMFLPEGGGPPDVYFRYVAAVDDPGGNNTHSVKLHFGGADQGLTLREWLERLASSAPDVKAGRPGDTSPSTERVLFPHPRQRVQPHQRIIGGSIGRLPHAQCEWS
jgi:hypothetical protein